MIYYLEIELLKKKLCQMIEKEESYNKILKQSRVVDKLINKHIDTILEKC